MATEVCDICGKPHLIINPNTAETITCPTKSEIQAFLEIFPFAEFGPAHILLSDYNVDEHSIGYVQGRIDERLDNPMYKDARVELEATREFVNKLHLKLYATDLENGD